MIYEKADDYYKKNKQTNNWKIYKINKQVRKWKYTKIYKNKQTGYKTGEVTWWAEWLGIWHLTHYLKVTASIFPWIFQPFRNLEFFPGNESNFFCLTHQNCIGECTFFRGGNFWIFSMLRRVSLSNSLHPIPWENFKARMHNDNNNDYFVFSFECEKFSSACRTPLSHIDISDIYVNY